MITLALALLLAQEAPEAALFKKCGSQIPWITDGTEIVDGTPKPPIDPSVDRVALLEKAKAQAREQKRLILWYCMRVPGTHTYRAAVLDTYMRAAIFTDPGVVDLVRARFVPLRMACDEKASAATGVRFPGFIEPGLIVLTPEGRIVHTMDRIRTFNADAIHTALVEVLRKNGESPGIDEEAIALRRAGRYREILDLPCAPLHKGIAHLGLQEFDSARKILEKEDSPEALYHLSAVEWWTGKEPVDLWKKLVERHPDSPWAWRAAANLVRGPDGLPQGPMAHNFEDFFLRAPVRGFDPTVARAVEFLLRAQRADGTWSDSRYSYGWAAYMIRRRTAEGLLPPGYSSWPDTGLHPNVFVAVTALAAQALLEWRDVAPDRIDAALARAEKFLRDDDNLSPARCEACYADTYRLMYFAAKKEVPRMNRMVFRLSELQDRDGFWSHEYPSAFATAAVVRCLVLARRAGADVPEAMLQRAAEAILKTRGEGGRQDYRHEPGKPRSSEKNSMGRTASSELALYECGRGSLENVAAGVDAYWKHLARLESVRICDNHADEELAGFFYFNSVFHTLEAARSLPEPARAGHLRRFRSQVLATVEPDGAFVDSHELGKSYGTAMALLILKRAGEPQVVDLWPGKTPDDVGIAGEERFRELKINGKAYEVGGKPTRWLTGVTKPTLTIYRPEQEKDTGVSMLICPGGGYHNLGWDVEGEEVAAWLNSIGITGIILKYRCPRRKGDVMGEPPLGPLKDAQRAVSLVRSKAKEWGLDPQRIGMVGFSAGGHLVGATATNFENRAYEPLDDVDKVSCRPDFAVMAYSGYFKAKDKDELSPTVRAVAGSPPMFLVHATDDSGKRGGSDPEHSVTMYLAMKKAGVPVELHLYASGGHGFGVRKVGHPCETWTERCVEWLKNRGLIGKP